MKAPANGKNDAKTEPVVSHYHNHKQMHILEDILAHNLFIVFCGSAVSRKSREKGCYYCGPGNKFWPQFSRITGRESLMPVSIEDCRIVLEYGIGLTDLNKTESGSDRSLTKKQYDTESFGSDLE